jgi:hypothetical protein
MIASDDIDALDHLEDLLTALAGSTGSSEVTLFYLKHARATVVAQTLNQILSGGISAKRTAGSGGRSVAGNLAGTAPSKERDSLVDSLLGLRSSGGSRQIAWLAGRSSMRRGRSRRTWRGSTTPSRQSPGLWRALRFAHERNRRDFVRSFGLDDMPPDLLTQFLFTWRLLFGPGKSRHRAQFSQTDDVDLGMVDRVA